MVDFSKWSQDPYILFYGVSSCDSPGNLFLRNFLPME